MGYQESYVTTKNEKDFDKLCDYIKSVGSGVYDTYSAKPVEIITMENGKKYLCTYSYDSEKLLNIYELSEDEDDEILVEKDIPYQVIKITNDNTEVYKLSDHV